MKLNFTLKLISFIYNETSSDENAEIVDCILTDAPSEEEYQELMEAKEMMDTVRFRPSNKSIERILEYSENFNCEST